MRRAPCTCIAVLLCLVGTQVHAQAMDLTGSQVVQQRPLELAFLVRSDTLPTSRAAHCVEGSFEVGNQHLPADEVQVTYTSSERPGWYRAVLRHPHIVDASALVARLVLRCPALYERELVIQTLPAEPGAPPMILAGAPVRRTQTAPDGPTHLQAERSPLARRTPVLPEPSLREAAASPNSTQPSRRPTPLTHAPETPALLQEEITRLRQELALERAKLQPRPFSTGTRLHRTAEPAPTNWDRAAWLGLAIPLLALLPWLRRRRSGRGPRIKLMEISTPQIPAQTQTEPELRNVSIPPRQPTPVPKPAPQASLPTTLAIDPPALTELALTPPSNDDLIPPTAAPTGAASLEDRDAAVFTRQVEDLVSDGYIGVAVELLEKSLHAGAAKNPWLLLQLLGLHQRMGHLVEVAQTISLLQTLYRVHLPTASGQILEGKDLLSQPPRLLDSLCTCWSSPMAAATLEDWLFRVPGPTWDLATFEDLLLLHAVAQNRIEDEAVKSQPAEPVRFEAVLEWSTDEA